MSYKKNVNERKKRHQRIRVKIQGSVSRPRLNVFRSSRHIYAQLIDDESSNTLVAVNTVQASIAAEVKGKSGREQADIVGKKLAELAKSKNVETVVFDRGGFAYRGRIKALADGARSGGLKF